MKTNLRFNSCRIFIFLFCFYSVIAANLWKCPTPDLLRPCTCVETRQELTCQGVNVTQTVVNQAFGILRNFNNFSATDPFKLTTFYLDYTNLTEFDVSPLLNCDFGHLAVTWNKYLSKIFGHGDVSRSRINADFLSLSYNALTDEGLQDTFLHFTPNTESITLISNNIQGSWVNLTDGSGDVEFIPGLTSFSNLTFLNLSGNNITRLHGGQFKRMSKLRTLNLSWNGLIELGEDALLIDQPHDSTFPRPMRYIDLQRGTLSEDNIHVNSGIQFLKNGWDLRFNYNQSEYISASNFQQFLTVDFGNALNFEWSDDSTPTNRFICDHRMKWLKDAAIVDTSLPSRVRGVLCTNDPGQTIFTTNLV